MDQVRQLRSVNAKLQNDKKSLQKRVADLEEEIKTRCRNYMNIIQKLKRGEGVQVSHIVDRSAEKEYVTPKKPESARKPLSMQNILGVQLVASAIDHPLHRTLEQQSANAKKSLNLTFQELKEVSFHNEFKPIEWAHQWAQTEVEEVVSPPKADSEEELMLLTWDQEAQTDPIPEVVREIIVPSACSLNHYDVDDHKQHTDDHAPAAWEPGSRWSVPYLSYEPTATKLEIPLEQQLAKTISEQVQTIKGLKARLKEIEKESLDLIKYRALCSQLLNYRPPSMEQMKRQIEKKLSNPGSKLGLAASAVETHVNSLLRKLQYYETIIYGVEGYPEKAKAKYNQKPLEKLIADLFSQIVAEEAAKQESSQLQSHHENTINALQEELLERDKALAAKQLLAEQSTIKPKSQAETPIKQLKEQPAPPTVSTSMNTEPESGDTNSLNASSVSASSKKSSQRKKLSVQMARHHMIMFSKDDSCKECANTQRHMNVRIDELTISHNRELGELARKYQQDLRQHQQKILQLTDQIQGLQKQVTNLEQQEKEHDNDKATGEQEVDASPLNRIGYQFKQLPVEEGAFVKRAFLQTTRMRKTTSTNKVTTRSLNKEEVKQHLASKLQGVSGKLEQLRSTHKQETEEAATLQNLKKKLNRMYRKYDDEAARTSQRSSESSQCQQSSTEIIEVRLETPHSTTEDMKLVTSRRYFPGEEDGRSTRFDFRKKVTPQPDEQQL